MSKKELKVKVDGQNSEIIGYLESIVKSLKEGTLVLEKGDSFVTLKPRDTMKLEIEGAQKDKKEGLKIELSWKTEQAVAEEAPENLVISSHEPVAETETAPVEESTEKATESTGFSY